MKEPFVERVLIKSVFGRVVLDTDVTACTFEVVASAETVVRATVPADVIERVRTHSDELHAFWFHEEGKSWLSDPDVEMESEERIRITFARRFDYPNE